MFPFAPGTASGSFVKGPGSEPGTLGTTIYLNGGEDLSHPLSRVEAAGGKVTTPKTSIVEHGFVARFQDSEGNIVALHSVTWPKGTAYPNIRPDTTTEKGFESAGAIRELEVAGNILHP